MKKEFVAYTMTSPQDDHYMFFLNSPKIIANQDTYFDEMSAYITFDQELILNPLTYYKIHYVFRNHKESWI